MMIAKVATLLLVICHISFAVGEVCYVCGSSKELISHPDNTPVSDEYGPTSTKVNCKTLESAGMNGLISEDACSDLHDSMDFKMVCGCSFSSDTNYVQTEISVMEASPSFSPFEQEETNYPTSSSENVPTIGMDTPSSFVATHTPIKYIAPTMSPTDAQSNEEKTEIPSTSQSINYVEGKNDVPWIASSNMPSETPSDVPSHNPSAVPSNVPSDVPSDAPSDVPSAQPTTDRDLSGVVVESSAHNASLLNLVQLLPTIVVAGLIISLFR
jgi:hypothetical protein